MHGEVEFLNILVNLDRKRQVSVPLHCEFRIDLKKRREEKGKKKLTKKVADNPGKVWERNRES